MVNYENVVNEIKSETEAENTQPQETATVEQTTETPVEQTNESPVEQTPTQTNETPVEQNPAPTPVDKSALSDLDKATYSFRRQLSKQKSKYEAQISDLEARLKKLETPAPERKYRDAFKTDDEYIGYLTEEKVNALMEAKMSEMQKNFEEQQERIRQSQEHDREIEEGINSWFPDDKRYEYQRAVEDAFGKGLSDLLEQEKNVLEYLHQTPNSSRILYEMATNPEVVQNIFNQRNPLFRLMAVRDLENKLVSEKDSFMKPAPTPAPSTETVAPAAPTQAPVNNLAKPIGRPGAENKTQPDIIMGGDDTKLKEMLRKI
jgi:chromosome segregation ATPase